MLHEEIDGDVVRAAIEEAGDCGLDVSALSLTRVARRAGISRATLFRRIGNREALDAAVRRMGVDPGTRRPVRERALESALELIEGGGLDALTLEQVASRAGCAVTSIHSQFDGREGFLAALYERYSPIVSVERLLGEDRPPEFRQQVQQVYEALLDVATRRQAVLAALISHVLASPSSPISGFVERTALPRLLAGLEDWLSDEAARGGCRAVPAATAVPLLLGPVVAHMAMRSVVERRGGQPPSTEAVIRDLTDAFSGFMETGGAHS